MSENMIWKDAEEIEKKIREYEDNAQKLREFLEKEKNAFDDTIQKLREENAPEDVIKQAKSIQVDTPLWEKEDLKKFQLTLQRKEMEENIKAVHLSNSVAEKCLAGVEKAGFKAFNNLQKAFAKIHSGILTVRRNIELDKLKNVEMELAAYKGKYLEKAVSKMNVENIKRNAYGLAPLSDPRSFIPFYAQTMIERLEKQVQKYELKTAKLNSKLRESLHKSQELGIKLEAKAEARALVIQDKFILSGDLDGLTLGEGDNTISFRRDVKDIERDAEQIIKGRTVEETKKLFGERITFDDAKEICNLCEYDFDVIKNAKNVLDTVEKGFKQGDIIPANIIKDSVKIQIGADVASAHEISSPKSTAENDLTQTNIFADSKDVIEAIQQEIRDHENERIVNMVAERLGDIGDLQDAVALCNAAEFNQKKINLAFDAIDEAIENRIKIDDPAKYMIQAIENIDKPVEEKQQIDQQDIRLANEHNVSDKPQSQEEEKEENTGAKEKEKIEQEHYVAERLGENAKGKDAQMICRAAGYNRDLIDHAFNAMDRKIAKGQTIEKPVGYLLSSIKVEKEHADVRDYLSKKMDGNEQDIAKICSIANYDKDRLDRALESIDKSIAEGREIRNPVGYMISTINKQKEKEMEVPSSIPELGMSESIKGMAAKDDLVPEEIEPATFEAESTVIEDELMDPLSSWERDRFESAAAEVNDALDLQNPDVSGDKELEGYPIISEALEKLHTVPGNDREPEYSVFASAKEQSKQQIQDSIAEKGLTTIERNLQPLAYVQFNSNGHDIQVSSDADGDISYKELDYETGKYIPISKEEAKDIVATDMDPVKRTINELRGEPVQEKKAPEKRNDFQERVFS